MTQETQTLLSNTLLIIYRKDREKKKAYLPPNANNLNLSQ